MPNVKTPCFITTRAFAPGDRRTAAAALFAKANPDTAVGNNCRNASRWIALEARFWLTGGFESADNFDPEQHREMRFAGFNCVKRRNWVPLIEDCRVRALVRCFDTRSEAHFADPTLEQDRSGSAI